MGLDDSSMGSPQFEGIACFQVLPVDHLKWHQWPKVKCAVLELKYIGHDDESVWDDGHSAS